MKEIAVLYSGGTDSTCAAALAADGFERIHLLTYSRFGVFCAKNTELNVSKLRDKFGKDKFIHRVMNIDRLFKEMSYSGYMPALVKHGFFLLTTCGLCKLAMHMRTLAYCLDNKISYVCDGANKNMDYSPDQMRELTVELKALYARYNIEYTVPVYEFSHPDDIGWLDKLGVSGLMERKEKKEDGAVTTGEQLFKMGIFPSKNMKGTREDRRMQARCFQLVLSNIFAHWLYIPDHGLEKYKKKCVEFYKEKIAYFNGLIVEYVRDKSKSRFYRLIN
jgi:predicted subunit of tRNA(5-methylaminomethyl-2-thiouridylate) methyltransferase